jgi:hypothetical protein
MDEIKLTGTGIIGVLHDPYFLAVGKVANEWNHLQEALGELFGVVAGINQKMAFAIWYSTQSDRTQREMLRAALSTSSEELWKHKPTHAQQDVTRLLNKADSIADQRNDAIHAPCSLGIEGGKFEMMPQYFFGNPRAKKLQGKNLLTELEWYAHSATALMLYSRLVTASLSHAHSPWPDRPQMPTLVQNPSHTK